MDSAWLPPFWAVLLAVAVFGYAVRDGYDLGVGILFAFARDRAERDAMVRAIAPFWDGNQVWLVLVGALLFAAFPSVYAILLPAFYLPLTLMLLALILRGVSFEFRHHAVFGQGLWNWGFFLGSLAASFLQGATVGAVLREIPVRGLEYAGGAWDWLGPFPLAFGLALVIADGLLGAAWLVLKTEGPLRERGYHWLQGLLPLLLAALFGLSASLAIREPRIAARWSGHPWLFVLPAAALSVFWGLRAAVRARRAALPYGLTAALFCIVLAGIGGSVWPYLLPFSVTVDQAAAPAASLGFLFAGGALAAFPLALLCTALVARFLRGKW